MYKHVASVLTLAVASVTFAQTSITGYNLALRSSGTRSSTAGTATLTDNGFVGTYITLAQPGQVTLNIDALGQAGGNVNPLMNVVVGDFKSSFNVGSSANVYTTTLNLPAGTHFVRTEFANDIPSVDRRLTVRNLSVTGATLSNTASSGNALAAADTYIASSRRGQASVLLPGVAANTPVQVKLKTHAFRFGAQVPGTSTAGSVNTLLANNPAANSTAAKYQAALLKNFNSVTPGNAGKWSSNEATQNVVTLGGVDRILSFAEANKLRVRQHNLIWGSQQPTYIANLLTSANNGDATARASLDAEIGQRTDYYVRQRASRFEQLDVYNESYHTGSAVAGANYYNVYGASGIAQIHNNVAAAVTQAGANTKLFVNEYNVLADNGTDAYSNWYRSHVETLRSAGAQVDGIGIQYYAHNQLGAGASKHDPSRMFAALQNLSVGGLPLELTEFGIKADGLGDAAANAQTAATVLSDSLRLAFGTASMSGFTHWGFWQGDVWNQAPEGVLYDQNFNLTPAGEAYQSLLNEQWSTNLTTSLTDAGMLDFNGFFGTYDITAGNQQFVLIHEKGLAPVLIAVPEPGMAMAAAAVGGVLLRRIRRK